LLWASKLQKFAASPTAYVNTRRKSCQLCIKTYGTGTR